MNKNIVQSKSVLYNTGFITKEIDNIRIKQGLNSQTISNYCKFTKSVYLSDIYKSNKEQTSNENNK